MRTLSKQIVALTAVAMLLFAAPLFGSSHTEEEPAEEEKVIVEVGDKTWGEEAMKKEMAFLSLNYQMDLEDLPAEYAQAMNNMARQNIVQRAILMAYAEEAGLEVDEESRQMLEMMMAQIGQDPDFSERLNTLGLSMDDIRDYMEDQVLIEQLVTNWIDEVEIADEEVRQYYEQNVDQFLQVNARHILIDVEEGADEETRQERREKAEDILARLEDGEDFAELAAEESACPSGQQQGGELGPFSRGQMVPEFEEAAFALSEGEMSGVIETQFGYHILQVLERKDSFEDVEEEAREMLQYEAGDRIFQEKLEEGRERFDVKEY